MENFKYNTVPSFNNYQFRAIFVLPVSPMTITSELLQSKF